MSSPLVYIIILNWNRKYDTLECLESLQYINYPNYKIIVVDNGSIDGSPQVIREKFPNITLIENKKNLGFAEGNNIAIKSALQEGADYVLLLNNDTIVDRNFLIQLVKVAESDPEIGICGPKIYHYDFPNKIWFAGGLIKGGTTLHIGGGKDDKGQFDKISVVDYITGCAMLVKRKVFEKVGLLDPDYFCMFEDADLCLRNRRAGFKAVYVPNARVWHKISSSFGGFFSPYWAYYMGRSNILFIRKNARLMDWLAFPFYFTKYFFTLYLGSIFAKNPINPVAVYYMIKGFIVGTRYVCS